MLRFKHDHVVCHDLDANVLWNDRKDLVYAGGKVTSVYYDGLSKLRNRAREGIIFEYLKAELSGVTACDRRLN